jgi:hypothetical protein
MVSYDEQMAHLKQTRDFIKNTWKSAILKGEISKKDFDHYIQNLQHNGATKEEIDFEIAQHNKYNPA